MNHLIRALDNQNQWWKYLVVFLAGFIGANTIGAIPLALVMVYNIFIKGVEVNPSLDNPMDLSAYGIDPNMGLILILFPFAMGLLLMVILFKPLHKRTLSEIINGTRSIRWIRILIALIAWFILMLVLNLIIYFYEPDNFIFQLDISSFVPLVIIALIFIPVQTAYEEILFRGYFAQGIGAWTKNRWLVVLIPSLLFALGHSFNPEVSEFGFWMTMPQYFIYGLIFGIISVLDDGIEIAIGAHAGNNIFSSVFITFDSSALQTPALFEQLEIYPLRELGFLIVAGTIFLFHFSKKYQWRFGIMNKKIESEIV